MRWGGGGDKDRGGDGEVNAPHQQRLRGETTALAKAEGERTSKRSAAVRSVGRAARGRSKRSGVCSVLAAKGEVRSPAIIGARDHLACFCIRGRKGALMDFVQDHREASLAQVIVKIIRSCNFALNQSQSRGLLIAIT